MSRVPTSRGRDVPVACQFVGALQVRKPNGT